MLLYQLVNELFHEKVNEFTEFARTTDLGNPKNDQHFIFVIVILLFVLLADLYFLYLFFLLTQSAK